MFYFDFNPVKIFETSSLRFLSNGTVNLIKSQHEFKGSGSSCLISNNSPSMVPPANSTIKFAAYLRAWSVISGSIPRSNRKRHLCLVHVFWQIYGCLPDQNKHFLKIYWWYFHSLLSLVLQISRQYTRVLVITNYNVRMELSFHASRVIKGVS